MSSVVLRNIASTHHDVADGTDLGSRPLLDADMQHVVDRLQAMGHQRFERGSPADARAQPTLSAAMTALLRGRIDHADVAMEMRMIQGPAGDMRARVYRPTAAGAEERLPMILYLHGGGFVVGDLDSTPATPRSLAARCRAVVVAAHYRQAPEFRFPAAYEDARAAWAWMTSHAESLGGDAARTAIAGEDAGANLALDVAIGARDAGGPGPRHMALVAPMAGQPGADIDSGDIDSLPVGAATIAWYYSQLLGEGVPPTHPRIDPAARGDLGGLPPTTMILAEYDPLRPGGERLASALRRAGVWVDYNVYEGVTHGFFPLARIVNKAMFAEGQVVRNFNESLS